MAEKSLFKESLGFGIGHGMIVQEDNEFYFFGHRKTSRKPGWNDRRVFYTKISSEVLEEYLQAIL